MNTSSPFPRPNLPHRARPTRHLPGFLALLIGLSAAVPLTSQPLESDDAIRKLRMGTIIIEAAPNTGVRIEQLRHEFSFGAALANQAFNGRLSTEETAKYKQVFLENFNSAVTENALKWHDMEPRPGQVNYTVVEGDPEAVLYLNDYDILTGRRLDDFMVHIRQFLDQGVAFAGIGVQGHLHGDSFDPVALQNALDRLAEFKLPIKITEFNFPGQRSQYYQKRGAQLTDEEEQAKARALVDYYRVCFAHPAVEGILMWGFWEGANWIPVSSLYRRDWTPTPAAEAYRDLLFKKWWTRWEGRTDAQGCCEVPAFFGKHRVTLGDKSMEVDLTKAQGTRRVQLQ